MQGRNMEKKRMKQKEYIIEGMHCPSCAETIEKNVRNVKGVKSCRVNFSLNKASVIFDDQDETEEKIYSAVDKAGYKVKKIDVETKKGEVILLVTGMMSDHCSGIVANSLKKVEGVKSVKTNIATSKAEIKFDQKKVNVSDLIAAVQKAGD